MTVWATSCPIVAATVRFDNKRVGMWAVDKIAGAEGVEPGVEHMLFPGVLVEGDTVRDWR